jgi:hypothetical protein
MMAKGSSKVQEQEKLARKKTCKARLKKDAHNPPQHDKVKKKSPENDVRSSLDRILHTGAQKGSRKVFGFTDSLKQVVETITLRVWVLILMLYCHVSP